VGLGLQPEPVPVSRSQTIRKIYREQAAVFWKEILGLSIPYLEISCATASKRILNNTTPALYVS